MRQVLAAVSALSLVIAASAVSAQTPPPSTSQSTPSTSPSTPSASKGTSTSQAPSQKGSKADKKAVSKSCSDQADAKGLHGKARKQFRSECKRNGGNAT
jgi:hypothetical protein